MAQISTRGTTPAVPTGVVTVADLLSRYAPSPVAAPESVTVPVSVGSLLRREGRAPHALDRPLEPRASQVRADSDDGYEDDGEPRRGTGMRVRRAAIAAGVLVAAGSVFGAAVVDDASSRAGADAQTQGGYPGQGRLDTAPLRDEAVPTVVDPAGLAALSEVLDAGEAPAGSWMTGVRGDGAGGTSTGVRSADTAAAAGGSASSTVDDARGGGSAGGDTGGSGTGGNGTGDAPGDGTGGSGGSGAGGSGAGAPAPAASSPSGGLGGAVQGVGGAVPGPLGGTVEGVGNGVGSLGDGVQSATGGDTEDPGPVGSVGRLAGSLL